MLNFLKQAVRPLEPSFQSLFGGNRRTNVSPTETIGHMGTALYGGYVVENERDQRLTDREKYRTFSEVLTNCSVAAAGIRYFLNLCAAADWNFDPADHPRGEVLAELAKEILFKDPRTSQARMVRRAAMYRFYGFSLQEWTAFRRDDGVMSMTDIAPRAQLTIERWDVNTAGEVLGVVQRNPQDQSETYLPRSKLIYLVDDSLNDSPQGLGLLRHIVEPARRLSRFEQLEGIGLETDLRGVPVGRAPYAELNKAVVDGQITAEQARAAVAGIEGFVKNRVKTPDLGVLVDSDVYASIDDAARPSAQKKFEIDLLQGNSTSLPDVARAITRLNGEIARVLGVEAILLGDGDRGSFALSQDKTSQFALTIDATMKELADSFTRDLLTPTWELNGWPIEAMPTMKPAEVRFRDVQQITASLRDMAQAGAVIMPGDEAVAEVFALMGLTAPTEAMGGMDDPSLVLGGRTPAPGDDEEDNE